MPLRARYQPELVSLASAGSDARGDRIVGNALEPINAVAGGKHESRRLGRGGLPERTKGHAWRACRGQPLAGSNPAATARRPNEVPTDQAVRHPGQRCGATGPGSWSVPSRTWRTSSNVSQGRKGTPSSRQILTRFFLANTMSEYSAP
jgi:hypothetical protein